MWKVYSDSANGGNSVNYGITFHDTVIQWAFQLKSNEHSQWPFIGLTKLFRSNDKQTYTTADTLIAEIKGNRPLWLTFKILSYDPEYTEKRNWLTYRNSECIANVDTAKKRIAIPLRLFKVADWWKRMHNIPADDNRLYLESIRKIDMLINDTRFINQIDTLQISSLYIKHKNKNSLFVLIYVVLLGILVYILFRIILKRYHQRCIQSPSLQPVQLIADPSDWERVMEYLKAHYFDPDLNICKVAKSIGFSESKLSHLINKEYPEGFRSLIHRLRIEEGKRLLIESMMNISEIAYKLGYATPNHFNREFKKRTALSPSAFRNAKVNISSD